jgi:hypothetical protein
MKRDNCILSTMYQYICKSSNTNSWKRSGFLKKKWISDLNLEGSLCNWNVIYKMPFALTTNSNLRYFQYRLCHIILTTNKFLHLIKVKDNNSCTFCEEVVEDLLNLFCKCKHVTPIWTTVKHWLNRCGFNNMVMFSHADILLGIEDQHVIVNFIILIVKM